MDINVVLLLGQPETRPGNNFPPVSPCEALTSFQASVKDSKQG